METKEYYIMVADDATEDMKREAIRILAKRLEKDTSLEMRIIKVFTESEVRQVKDQQS